MPMKGQAKRPKFVAKRERRILGENIEARMREATYLSENDKVSALAEVCDVSRSTVQRLIKGDVGATIDTIALFAKALRCEAHELLTPLPKTLAPR